LFFKPIVDIVFHYVGDTSNMQVWWLPWSSFWFTQPAALYYLAAPAMVVVASIVLLTARLFRFRFAMLGMTRAFLVGQFAFLGLLWIFWQSIGHVALQPDYFAYPLIIPMMLALAGLAAPRADVLLPAVLAAAFLAGILAATRLGLGLERLPIDWSSQSIIVVLLAGFGITLLALWIPRISMGASLVCVGYVAFLLVLVLAEAVPSWSAYGRQCSRREQQFDFMMSFESAIRRPPARTFIWLPPDEAKATEDSVCENHLPHLKGSLASLGYSTFGVIDQSAEDLGDDALVGLRSGDYIAALVADEGQITALKLRLQRAGKTLASTLRESHPFEGRQLIFAVLVVS
jgi:hypothetical protein